MVTAETNRELLLGELALALNLINAETLDAAKAVWADDKTKSLGQILVDRQAISPHTHGVLENLVQMQMAQDASQKGDTRMPSTDAARENDVAALTAQGESAGGAPSEGEPTAPTLRFHKLKALAAAEWGQVFLAHDTELDRRVALKEIKEDCADSPEARARFLQEEEIIGRLEHPGVVPVYGMGTYADGRPFYAMRFFRGESLAEAIKTLHRAAAISDPGQQAIELRRLLGRFIAVCQTMQYAHERDIVHGDLKPSNIMLGGYGETLVVEWGLARDLSTGTADATGTQPDPTPGNGSTAAPPSGAIGTLSYISPEQAAGRVQEVGPLSDVYSLGATLFTLLTGRAAVEDAKATDGKAADALTIQSKVVEGKIQRPRDVNPGIDRALAAICTKAMALRPADRYNSCRALADDLECWLGKEPVSAYREPRTVRARRWLGRQRTLLAGVAAAVLVGIIGLVAFSVNLSMQRHALKVINKDQDTQIDSTKKEWRLAIKRRLALEDANKILKDEITKANTARKIAEDAQQKAADTLALNTTMLAQSRWHEGQVVQASELLEQVSPDHRFGGWYFLRRQFEGSYATLYGHTDAVRVVQCSPNGEVLASVGKDGKAILWSALTGRNLGTLERSITSIAFSPDGKKLAVGGADGRILPCVPGNDSRVTLQVTPTWVRGEERMPIEPISSLAYSPDGKRLASASQDGKIKISDADTLKNPLAFKNGHSSGVTSLSFRPDGKHLASTGLDKSLIIWDPTTGEALHTFTLSTNGIAGAVYSADGKHLVIVDDKENIKILKADDPGAEVQSIKSRHASPITAIAFSPDGQRLVTASSDGTIKIWDVHGSKEPTTLQGHVKGVLSVSFSPDGQRLASASADWTVKLWDLVSGQEAQSFAGPLQAVTCAAFDPQDNQRLASGAGNGALKVWNALTGATTWELDKAHAAAIRSVSFSADGSRLASAGQDGKIRLCDADTGKEVAPAIQGHASPVNGVAWSRVGMRLASASADKTVKVWDALKGDEICTIKQKAKADENEFTSVSFSPDALRLASADRGGVIQVWDLTNRAELVKIHGHAAGITVVAFSPDGEYLVSAGEDGKVTIWNARTGQLLMHCRGHAGGVMSVAFSRDGKRFASAGKDGTITMWDARTGQDLKTFHGHDDRVISVAFSLDGTRLTSASLDRTVRLWDAASAQEVLTLKGQHTRPIVRIAFSADGKTIFSHDEADKLIAWNVADGKASARKDQPPAGSPISPDGKKLALPFANWFYLIDLQASKEETDYRENMSRVKPWWHEERALHYEKGKKSYAVAYHWSWVVHANPDDQKNWHRWNEACRTLTSQEVELLRRQAELKAKKN